ncbi:MAG TPA: antibiotic biosynthesis monooxygenase [Terriglobales bacterium]|nr:antibiotic biosynthesis monooxygenase [Terriglobales bacterium]
MFTRIVDCTVKPEKKEEYTQRITNEVMPILQKQPGFVDCITLTSDTDPERVVAISFWNTKNDAERYHRENYSRIMSILEPALQNEPRVHTYNVEQSTAHKIAAGKAA